MTDEDDDSLPTEELNDSDVPPPAKRRKRVPLPDDARELKSTSDLAANSSANGENGSSAQLLALAFAFHPFTALFERLAISRYPRKQSKRACVDAHVENHPNFYRFCVVADSCAVGAIVAIFVATLALGAWKTLFGHF